MTQHDVHREIDEMASEKELTDMDCFVIWQLGVSAWNETQKLGAQFPLKL